MNPFCHILLPAILLAGNIISFAQTREIQPVAPVRSSQSLLSLEARFTADKTSGAAPLEVHFTDQSTGSPTTWQWEFGDGGTSSDQHPVHTYPENGSYTVKLTISDGTSFYTLEKQNYIIVRETYSNCDTLHFPLPEPLIYYYYKSPNFGYLTGNNSYGDKVVADYFDNELSHAAITGIGIDFAKAVMGVANENIVIGFWDLDTLYQRPGNLMATDTISLATIVSDVAANRITRRQFLQPVHHTLGPFFAGVYLPTITGDTLVLWSTQAGGVPVNTGWIMDKLNQWSSLVHITNLNFSTAIYPEVCSVNGIAEETAGSFPFVMWPNPADDYIFIRPYSKIPLKNTRYNLINTTGQVFQSGTIHPDEPDRISIQSIPDGIYLLLISDGFYVSSGKIIIRH